MSMLDDGTSCFHKAKRVYKMEKQCLHTEKHSKDSVELTGLCKLLFFTLLVDMFAVCLASAIALDIGSTDSEDQEKQFLVTYAISS